MKFPILIFILLISKVISKTEPTFFTAVNGVEYALTTIGIDPLVDLTDVENMKSKNLKALIAAVPSNLETNHVVVFCEYATTSIEVRKNRAHTRSVAQQIPSIGEIPCDIYSDTNKEQILTRGFSCLAASRSTYIVANVIELCNDKVGGCAKGERLYSTTIAFDRDGAVLAKYRKANLFLEPGLNTPAVIAPVTFDTDFGVTFGLLTSTDILYEHPAMDLVNLEVTEIIIPFAMTFEVPLLTPNQLQFGWYKSIHLIRPTNIYFSCYEHPKEGYTGCGKYLADNQVFYYLNDKDCPIGIICTYPDTASNFKNLNHSKISNSENIDSKSKLENLNSKFSAQNIKLENSVTFKTSDSKSENSKMVGSKYENSNSKLKNSKISVLKLNNTNISNQSLKNSNLKISGPKYKYSKLNLEKLNKVFENYTINWSSKHEYDFENAYESTLSNRVGTHITTNCFSRGEFCCTVEYQLKVWVTNVNYNLVAFKGWQYNSDKSEGWKVQTCAVIACVDELLFKTDCAVLNTNYAENYYFEKIKLIGYFSTDLVFPTVLKTDLDIIVDDLKLSKSIGDDDLYPHNHIITLDLPKPVKSVQVFGLHSHNLLMYPEPNLGSITTSFSIVLLFLITLFVIMF